MEPPEPADHSRCDSCGSEVAEETFAIGSKRQCRPHALLQIAEMTMDGFAKLDPMALVAVRDVLGESLDVVNERLFKLTGKRYGDWA